MGAAACAVSLLAFGSSPFHVSAAVAAPASGRDFLAALEAYGNGGPIRLPGTIEDLRIDLNTAGRAWAAAGEPTDHTRRAHVLALVALDAATVASPSTDSWRQVRLLLAWASAFSRAQNPGPFEREWTLAMIALAEQHRDDAFLLGGPCGPPDCNQVNQALARFPDDPILRRAVIFARREVNVVTRRPGLSASDLRQAPPPGYPWTVHLLPNDPDARRVADSVARLARLALDPELGQEARLRLGILEYELGRLDDSRRDLAPLVTSPSGGRSAYLAHIITGLGFNSLDRADDAGREFEAAVAIAPLIVSGATELATYDFLSGRRDEGSLVLDRALAASPAHEDPWLWSCADCAGWTGRLTHLHAEVRK